MTSLRDFVQRNLPGEKPELWANLRRVLWRQTAAWTRTQLDPSWPTRPLVAALDRGGLVLEVIPADVIGAPIARFGVFELAPTRLLQAYLKQGDVFVDVGANIGYYSIIAASITGSVGKVYAFEPSPKVRKQLRRNVDLNRMTDTVEIRSEAVLDRQGTVELIEPKNTGNDGLAYVSSQSNGVGLAVTSVRLDALQELTERLPALIKIDVEGAELRVFDGAQGLLAHPNAPSIIFESFDIARDAAVLSGCGYLVFQPQLRYGSVRLTRNLHKAPYRKWEAPNYLAVKSSRGCNFARELEIV